MSERNGKQGQEDDASEDEVLLEEAEDEVLLEEAFIPLKADEDEEDDENKPI